ncbi:MAG: TIGR03790 family protein [Burkholderiaceae bacterium]|nr:TIGR03790 family protein [Burkholderiaceae bacterium]
MAKPVMHMPECVGRRFARLRARCARVPAPLTAAALALAGVACAGPPEGSGGPSGALLPRAAQPSAAASADIPAVAAAAGPASGVAVSPAAGASAVPLRLRWMRVPRVIGRIDAPSLGLIVNLDDPYSVQVGERYAARRGIPPEQVLRVHLPRQPRLSQAQAAELREAVERHFGPQVQGLALAWVQPYAVECQSITAVLTLGFDPQLCRNPCGKPAASRYFDSASGAPWRDLALRPSMLLAAGGAEQALALIERGIAADASLGLRGGLPAQAWFMATRDAARSVRLPLFPPPTLLRGAGVRTQLGVGDLPRSADRLLLLQTGAARLQGLEALPWLPGALADHLTSFGGQLDGASGQTPATAWIDAGATASYGTVSEPCNHPGKFPHPQLALLHYLQGSSALEAYWKSVKWPQQGLFVGEPLAAPFARPAAP